jgi:FkbH-like protein
LVVWDLDDTLWEGTLDEGSVRLNARAAEVVRTLNRRGIVNSICSRNDPDQVRRTLETENLWEEFVFPSIGWEPKGERLARLIEDMQLRPANVLFIDDLPVNREAARYAAPDIQTAGPEILDGLLDRPQCTGRADPDRTRLQQYRLLERRAADRQRTPGSHLQFLRHCEIRVEIGTDSHAYLERLHDLMLRTNQLNFTRRRLSETEFEQLLSDPEAESGYISVTDRYGDYGICGFYSRDLRSGHLTDFLFSCRILDMGVEQWLYERLGRPPIDSDIERPVDLEAEVDWIVDATGPGPRVHAPSDLRSPPTPTAGGRSPRLLMMGGCDLQVVSGFLGGDVVTDFARNAASGAFMHVEHSEILRQARVGLTAAQAEVVEQLPMIDLEAFVDRPVFDADYDVLVLSLLMDYSQGLYRHRTTGLVVPWELFDVDTTDQRCWAGLDDRWGSAGIDRAFLEWFSAEFDALGPLREPAFVSNLRWLCGVVGTDVHVVFLNGAEVSTVPERDQLDRHRRMNRTLEQVVATIPNASICDVRPFVQSDEDLRSDLRHYRRRVYLPIAMALRDTISDDVVVRHRHPFTRRVRQVSKRSLRRLRSRLGRARRRLRSGRADAATR